MVKIVPNEMAANSEGNFVKGPGGSPGYLNTEMPHRIHLAGRPHAYRGHCPRLDSVRLALLNLVATCNAQRVPALLKRDSIRSLRRRLHTKLKIARGISVRYGGRRASRCWLFDEVS